MHNKFKNKKLDLISIIGFTGTILAFVATQISGWSQQKEMERTIEEQVNTALEKRNYFLEEKES